MTLCTFSYWCDAGYCCDCGACISNSSVTAIMQATETNITALMSSGSLSWDCEDDCDMTNSFCFKGQCYTIEDCEGECDGVLDCDTCFCGFCFDDNDDDDTDETVTSNMGSQTADSSKKPDVFLTCLVLAAVVLIGVIGLLYVKILNRRGYNKFEAPVEKTPVCVETTVTEIESARRSEFKKSDVYF